MQDFAKNVDLLMGLWDQVYALSVESIKLAETDRTLSRKVRYDALKTLQNFEDRYTDMLNQSNPYKQLGSLMERIANGEKLTDDEVKYGLNIIVPLQNDARRKVEGALVEMRRYFKSTI